MVYAARLFDGVNDRLDTGLNVTKGSTDTTSGYCWVMTPSGLTTAGGSLFGAADGAIDGNGRIQFRVFFGYVGFQPTMQLQTLSKIPLSSWRRTATTNTGPVGTNNWAGVPIFVAWVNDVANNRMRFFWGFTAATVVEMPTSAFTTVFTATEYAQLVNTTVKVNIGATGREPSFGTGAEDFINATIDSVGLEFDVALTLEQLKLRAFCGENAGTYYWPIDGTDPEPGIVAIHGTEPVGGICDPFVEPPDPEPEPPPGEQLLTCM